MVGSADPANSSLERQSVKPTLSVIEGNALRARVFVDMLSQHLFEPGETGTIIIHVAVCVTWPMRNMILELLGGEWAEIVNSYPELDVYGHCFASG
jgi:hypothetical protein